MILMKLLKWLDKKFTKWNRKRVIHDPVTRVPYLVRYYLFLKERKRFPINIFLHNILVSDDDRALHDHPWGFCSIILRGGYWEHTPKGRFWRKPGSIRFAGAKSLHRIELEPNTDVWTIFITSKRVRDWGFIDNGEWVDHQTYLQQRYNA